MAKEITTVAPESGDSGTNAVIRKLRERLDALEARHDALEAKVDRHSDNWVRAASKYMDATSGGRIT